MGRHETREAGQVKRKLWYSVTALMLCVFVGLQGISLTRAASPANTGGTLYEGEWVSFDKEAAVSVFVSEKEMFEASQSRSYSFSITEEGDYFVILKYKTENDLIIKNDLTVEIGGQSCVSQIYSLWKDESKQYGTDRYGNESPARQISANKDVTDYVRNLSSADKSPFVYTLTKGEQMLTITNGDEPLALKGIYVLKAYEKKNKIPPNAPKGSDFIVIEGEDYSIKSDSYIRGGAFRNEALYPYDYRVKKINALDGGSFRTAGQKVSYGFEVKQAGVYYIGFRYSQTVKEGLESCANIEIDGEFPAKEHSGIGFSHTKTGFANMTVSEGVYLEKGFHTIAVMLDAGPVQESLEKLSGIMAELSELGLEIKKLSGSIAAEAREWNVEDYLPGVTQLLTQKADELNALYEDLGTLQEKSPAAAVNAKLAVSNLKKLVGEPKKLPQKLSLLNEGSGSATQLIADLIDILKDQSVSIDRLYVYDGETPLPAAQSGWIEGFLNSSKRFFYTLFKGRTDAKPQEDELVVWMNRPIHYMELLQTMCDTGFTQETGIKVRIALMPGEQKLVLSNAADTAPDAVLGLGVNVPYDLGIRGAVADLRQFPDFAEYIKKEYNQELLTPYIHENKIFGVTETQEFYVLCYRKDILDKLSLKPPQTWDDVAAMMPVLRRNSMDFYLQLSGWSGTKPLYTTLPFIVQAGGTLYSKDGIRPDINSKESVKGFETLVNLYRLYNVPVNVVSFYNSFRYGQIPVGIASFTDYVKIKNAAPEIANLWEIALSPGTKDENGNINRGTTAASGACAIMENSDKKEQAWEFLKWWLQSETQIEFSNALQTTFGPEYLWNSANEAAFESLSFPKEDKAVIKEQWAQTKEIRRHPALYSVERALSDAWMQAVLSGKPPRIALDNASSAAGREFTRKLFEFGYLDEKGNSLKEYFFVPVEELLR